MTTEQPDGRAESMAAEDSSINPPRRIRVEEDLWERFETAVKRLDPDSNRSASLRRYMRWVVGDIDEMPQRPEPKRGER